MQISDLLFRHRLTIRNCLYFRFVRLATVQSFVMFASLCNHARVLLLFWPIKGHRRIFSTRGIHGEKNLGKFWDDHVISIFGGCYMADSLRLGLKIWHYFKYEILKGNKLFFTPRLMFWHHMNRH